jgi:[acyl-carrier-protein] S-malonyltransferase
MGKVAFVFPGQGSQKVGMGADLLESDPAVFDRYLTAADEASGLPIRKLCLEGPIEELTETDRAQPALFAVSLAVLELAREQGMQADFVAGHSLGEYTAATAAGAIGVDDGMALVAERGRLMAAIQSERPGAMAAVIGLPAEQLADLCEQASDRGSVALANLNTPVQIVVSGEEAGVVRVMELAEEAGADKVVRLKVGAAFHSSLMTPVQERLAERMQEIAWSDPDVPLASNASGRLVGTADEVREALVAQIASPVRWVDCVNSLVGEGVSTVLEVGPGRVLGGLVRQVDPDVTTFSADSRKKLGKFAEVAA